MTVDVPKLACEFVRLVVQHLVESKYIINPCLDDIHYFYSKYKLATSLEECLTHEDKCDLSIITDGLPDPIVEDPIVYDCFGLVNITLTKSSYPCSYTVSLQTLDGIDSAFPVLAIEDNTIYQPAYLRVKVKGCSEEEYSTVNTGCLNLSNLSPVVCDAIYNEEVTINYRFKDMLLHSTGYIRNMVVYETDSSGLLINSPITLDLSPSNLTAWISCPLCSGITASDLYFGSPNWAVAFKELLDNVTYTLHGALNSAWVVSTTPALNILTIGNTIKHNPSGEWLGINKYDYSFSWVNNSNVLIKGAIPAISYSGTLNAMADNFSIPMDCGTVTGRVVMTGGSGFDYTQSNFNEFVVNEPTFNKPASIVNLVSPTCTKTTLTASYTLNSIEELQFTQWLDSEDNVISEDLSVVVTEPDTYRFVAYIGDGCVSDETIVVP